MNALKHFQFSPWHTIVFCALFLCALTASAKTYYPDNENHVYPNVVLVDVPGMTLDPGYLISSTMVTSSGQRKASLKRVDNGGALLWQYTYDQPGAANVRFTDIELIDDGGQVAFIATGQCDVGGMDHVLLMKIDENGALIQSSYYDMGDFSIGLHCIQASDQNYAIVGAKYSGSLTATDPKTAIFLKVDQSLNIMSQMWFDTPITLVGDDYDMAEHIIEASGPDMFFITGMVNNSFGAGPGVMSILINSMNMDAIVIWNKSFETTPPPLPNHGSHWDIGASALFDNNTIWVLGNNSIRHMFNLTQFDLAGNLIFHMDFDDLDSMYEFYGYTLQHSQSGSGYLAIHGWQKNPDATGDIIMPFFVDFHYPTLTVVAQKKYQMDNYTFINYHDIPWLSHFPNSQMPYFTPDIASLKTGQTPFWCWAQNNSLPPFSPGYAVMGIEQMSNYDVNIFGSNTAGEISPTCMQFTPNISPTRVQRHFLTGHSLGNPSAPINSMTINSGAPTTLAQVDCYTNHKHDESTSEQHVDEVFGLFPNPAHDVLTLTMDNLEEADIEILDMSGKLLERHALVNTNGNMAIDISGLATGLYIMKISSAAHTQTLKFMKN